jgi:hypothetical protein
MRSYSRSQNRAAASKSPARMAARAATTSPPAQNAPLAGPGKGDHTHGGECAPYGQVGDQILDDVLGEAVQGLRPVEQDLTNAAR